MAEESNRLADRLHERRDVLELPLTRVIRVVTAQTPSSRAQQVAREVVDEEREHEEPRDVAVTQATMDQDERRPLSQEATRDPRAVLRHCHLDPILVHVALLDHDRLRQTKRRDAPGRIRTCDLALRRRALYPLSYGRGDRPVYRRLS